MGETKYFQIKIIFVITTIFLLSLSILSYIRINNLLDASALVNSTNIVKLELENVFSNLKDIESEQRGYMLTNDVSFVEHTKLAEREMYFHLNNFDSLTKDNLIQQRYLKTLRKLLDKKLKNQNTIFSEAKSTKIPIIRWQRSKKIMDAVRVQIDKMIATENQLSISRNQLFNQASLITPMISILLIISGILILIISYYRIMKELRISNQLKADIELRESELIIANMSLLEKNTSLDAMNKELESFTYISSHDLQEPLRKIQTFVDRILENEYPKLSDNGKNYLMRTQLSANRMQALIQDLLAYSRTKTEVFGFEKIALKELIDEVKNDLKEEIEEKKALIKGTSLPILHLIKPQFRQLLINLFSNAVKFSKPNVAPVITIESSVIYGFEIPFPNAVASTKYQHLSIKDNGIGFDPEYKERVFEVFQRLHTKDEYEGTGVGLAIVKKIVENHKGFINAKSNLNEGATFNIYLPMV